MISDIKVTLEYIDDNNTKWYSLSNDIHFKYKKRMIIISHATFLTKSKVFSNILLEYLLTDRTTSRFQAYMIYLYALKLEGHSIKDRYKILFRVLFR